MSTTADAERMANDPATYFGGVGYEAHHLPQSEISQLQLAGLQERLTELKGRLPVLSAMVDGLQRPSIEALNDAAPLLFPHTVYKSYPPSLLEKGRFDQMTKWLGRLTTSDLSRVKLEGCEGIDDWLDALDRDTDVRVLHSSGTTGSMTFLPRSRAEYEAFFRTQRMTVSEFIDPANLRDHRDEHFDVIWGTYSRGRSGQIASVGFFRDYLAGSAERFHPVVEGRVSADVMYLAAKLKAASARGEVASLKISPHLLARRDEIEATRLAAQAGMGRLFDQVVEKLRGKRVFIMIQMVAMHEMALEGLKRQIRGAFAKDSVIHTGGGTKGVQLPGDWEAGVREFSGVSRIGFNYGMTELNMACYVCEHDRYHLPPWVILYVLDPQTGAAYPREGSQTGRAAFFDLIPQTYWGGFISGDEVQADWRPCPCGRTTPHIARGVQRYTEKRGGDDKITCAAAEEAHQDAMDLLRHQAN